MTDIRTFFASRLPAPAPASIQTCLHCQAKNPSVKAENEWILHNDVDGKDGVLCNVCERLDEHPCSGHECSGCEGTFNERKSCRNCYEHFCPKNEDTIDVCGDCYDLGFRSDKHGRFCRECEEAVTDGVLISKPGHAWTGPCCRFYCKPCAADQEESK